MNITDLFPNYIKVGHVKKSYGVHGHVRVSIEVEYQESIESAPHCFFLLRGCMVPYFIDERGDGLLKFESCQNPEDTKVIASRTVYLHQDQVEVSQNKKEELSFAIVRGFDLYNDATEKRIGKVLDVLAFPEQEMAVVQIEGAEHYFPLNDQNVKGIDMESQILFAEVPEGMFEL